MNKFIKYWLLITGLSTTPFTAADLIITSVFDGPLSGGLPKGVEVYATADITDLSQYGLGGANNGGGTDGEEFTFPSMPLSAGDYVYVASEANGFAEFLGFAPNFTSSAMSINGDDAIELFKEGRVIDLYGDTEQDGTGENWEYTDGWAYRISSSASSTFNINDWQVSGPNALDGSMSNDTAIIPIPLASFGGSTPPEPDPITITLISTIQGNRENQQSNNVGDADVSPLIGEKVAVEAVVVGDFQANDDDESRNLNGFYLQEEDSDNDGDLETSEGVFVFSDGFPVDVNLGDKINLIATVGQFLGETQLSNVTNIEIIASDQLARVTPAVITLDETGPVTRTTDGKYQPDLEAYEGMLVTFPQTLTITEQFQLARFNEIKLVAGERPFQFTQNNAPNAILFDESQQQLGAIRITYDDGLNTQNANIALLDGFSNYTEASATRMGDAITGLTGVLDYKWAGNSASQNTWRIRSHLNGSNLFTSTANGDSSNPRTSSPEQPVGNLSVASLNVLNFFTTLDDGTSMTAAGHFPRGADDLTRFGIEPAGAELDRQLVKLTNAILALDADIIALVEIENDFDEVNNNSTAIEILINTLNANSETTEYNYVYPGSQFVGSDAIAVAFIYQTNAVAPTDGSSPAQLDDDTAMLLPSFIDHDFVASPIFNGPSTNRVSFAVTFTHLESGEQITAVANHFKSKGSSGLNDETSANFDQQDGAGFWNQRRLNGAIAVQEWLASNPTGIATKHNIVLGDLNAYAMEEPIQYLLDNGFYNVEDEDAYSFVFDGQIGTLDYLLISDSLIANMTSANVWHINADEANALDYNLDFGRSPEHFDATTATRNSDHDPIIAGFQFEKALEYQPLFNKIKQGLKERALRGTGRHSYLRRFFEWKTLWLASYADQLALAQKPQACVVLTKLDAITDGEKRPRDWLRGSGIVMLNRLILDNKKSLDCL